MISPMLRIATAAILLGFALPQPAYAYIDPGTGSLIVQGLVAFFVGAAFTMKTFFYEKIKPAIDWILRRPKKADPPPAPDAGAESRKE